MSFLEIRTERRQKSIFVEFSVVTVFAFKHPVSAAESRKHVKKNKPYWNRSKWGIALLRLQRNQIL